MDECFNIVSKITTFFNVCYAILIVLLVKADISKSSCDVTYPSHVKVIIVAYTNCIMHITLPSSKVCRPCKLNIINQEVSCNLRKFPLIITLRAIMFWYNDSGLSEMKFIPIHVSESDFVYQNWNEPALCI